MKGLWRAKSYGESRGSFRKKIPVKYFIKDKFNKIAKSRDGYKYLTLENEVLISYESNKKINGFKYRDYYKVRCYKDADFNVFDTFHISLKSNATNVRSFTSFSSFDLKNCDITCHDGYEVVPNDKINFHQYKDIFANHLRRIEINEENVNIKTQRVYETVLGRNVWRLFGKRLIFKAYLKKIMKKHWRINRKSEIMDRVIQKDLEREKEYYICQNKMFNDTDRYLAA